MKSSQSVYEAFAKQRNQFRELLFEVEPLAGKLRLDASDKHSYVQAFAEKLAKCADMQSIRSQIQQDTAAAMEFLRDADKVVEINGPENTTPNYTPPPSGRFPFALLAAR